MGLAVRVVQTLENVMKLFSSLLLVVLLTPIAVAAQTSPDAVEIQKLLNQFLAATADPAMHERFWADDLIYTRSAGRRVSKADVLRDVRSAPAPKPGDPKTVFTSEDVRIQQYGDTAVVAFQLVGTTQTEFGQNVSRNLNSGTFVKREGKWQVVNWQSTRMAKTEEDSRKEVAASEAALFRALLEADTKRLTSLIDQSFVWTHGDGKPATRQQLIAALTEGRLKYSKIENAKVTYSISGETAIVRGESTRQRSAIPDKPGQADATPITTFFTLTFVSQGGPWRAVAMHTSQN